MPAIFTIKEILGKAIVKEIASHQLYMDLQRRVMNKAAKDSFGELAQQELEHKRFLEKYRHGELKKGALSQKHVVDYKIAEHLEQPELSENMELKDVFLFAANRERHAHELYLGLAEIHPAGEVKVLLKKLASEELKHKQKMEYLYNEVAFPQTDGG